MSGEPLNWFIGDGKGLERKKFEMDNLAIYMGSGCSVYSSRVFYYGQSPPPRTPLHGQMVLKRTQLT